MSKSVTVASKVSNFPSIGAVIALTVCVVSIVYLWKLFKKPSDQVDSKSPAEPKIPPHLRQPERVTGGLRTFDSTPLTEEQEKKRKHALHLAQQKKIIEAATLLEDIKLRREAVDLLEANSFFDEAAEVLMRINRPGRAAVIYERNKVLGKAALYYLKANLKEDAKRCCKNPTNINLILLRELAVLFAQAGEASFALKCLKNAKDGEGIINTIRATNSYEELTEMLDDKESRDLLLKLISPRDFGSLMKSILKDDTALQTRAVGWINESKNGEWIVALMSSLGENRGMARKLAEQMSQQTLESFVAFLEQSNRTDIEKNRTSMEHTGRALYDAGHWAAAAVTYESIAIQTLAGICWAMQGNSFKAVRCLQISANDQPLYREYLKALAHLGRTPHSTHPLEKHEQETIMRVFFNVDPDTERLKANSPF